MDANMDFREREIIQPFDLRDVQLLPGRLRDQFEAAVEYFMVIPEEDMLVGFRRRAGLPHPGEELGGWYSNDSSFTPDFDEIFNTFGQWLSGLARMAAVTQDSRIYDRLTRLILEWGKTVEPDGYFFYSNNCNAHHYVYDKMVYGLVDALVYCEFAPAADLLAKITRWAVLNLARQRNPPTPQHPTGGYPPIHGTDNEWYTLGENLYRAYRVTGDALYRDFARLWHYDTYWNSLAEGRPEAMTGLHGYSHVNTLSSAAMAYQVSGDPHYLKVITGAYDLFRQYQWMASGGYAPGESLAGADGTNGKALETNPQTFEVICGSWAGFKLSNYMVSFTGEARFGEWSEKLLYNAIGAALPMRDDGFRRGHTYYYADYRLGGGRKVYHPCSFPCCAGTYPQAVTEYHNLIYYHDREGLYVSQYIPSRVQFEVEENHISLSQDTNYPEENNSTLTIQSQAPVNFSLRLRLPAWAESSRIALQLNDERMHTPEVQRGWLVLKRTWQPGDRLKINLPMELRFEPISPAYPQRAALMVGPVMLALKGEQGGLLHGDLRNPEAWIEKNPAEDLHFRLAGERGDRQFVPFYEIGERQKYFVYNDVLLR